MSSGVCSPDLDSFGSGYLANKAKIDFESPLKNHCLDSLNTSNLKTIN